MFLAPLLLKRTKGRFFTLPRTDVSLLMKFYNWVLCLSNNCLQPLHHTGGKNCSCCHATLPLHQLPGHLKALHTQISSPQVNAPRRITLLWACKAVWSETHHTYIFSWINCPSGQRSQSAPGLQHIGITTQESHPRFSLCCFPLSQHFEISTGEHSNPQTLLPPFYPVLSFINISCVSVL